MRSLTKVQVAQIAVLATAVPVLLFSYAEGPDAAVSGAPGESTCTACHRPGGSATGSVQVTFAGGLSYTPGVKQHLVVTVADSAQRRWGFQLTARLQSNSKTQAGTFTPGADGYTQLACTQATYSTETFGNTCSSSYPLQYVEHTNKGTRNGTRSSVTFEFDWTPPAADSGNVVVYVAGNAANGDGTENGDHIYTQKYTLAPAAPVPNKPIISQSGVVNAASYQGPIAPGAWVTVQGTNLANSTRSWRADDIVNGQLPTQLDGVSVTINGAPAYVAYISPTQINVQAPSDSSAGPVAVQVTNNGATSDPANVDLEAVSPAFFLWNGQYAVATRSNFSLVGPTTLFTGATTPAKPGELVILWGTGLGATSPNVPAGQVPPAANVSSPVTVTVGGIPAQVLGAAISPGSPGLYQVAIQVPDAAPDGDQLVVAQISGMQSPSGVYLSVQR